MKRSLKQLRNLFTTRKETKQKSITVSDDLDQEESTFTDIIKRREAQQVIGVGPALIIPVYESDGVPNLDSYSVPIFSPIQIREATKNFSRKLGGGGQSTVFRGNLLGYPIAVKQYSAEGFKDMKVEMRVLQKVRHSNVIMLLGYCPEERCIVSEFMAGGSLQDRLRQSPSKLHWAARMQIVKEIVAATQYLHSQSILHRDLKPGNVLFDSHGTVKVADFGLSKVLVGSANHSDIRGTIGYLDPFDIAFHRMSRTESLDIYAIGLIILQICIHKYKIQDVHNIFCEIVPGEKRSSPHAINLFKAAMVPTDSTLSESEVMELLKVGLQCAERSPKDRPTLVDISLRLDIQSSSHDPLTEDESGEEALMRAKEGDASAQFEIGQCFEQGTNGLEKDYVEAIFWFDMAARKGMADADNALWILCWENIYTHLILEKLDVKKGLGVLEEAAKRDVACAQHCLGRCYYSSHGVETDYEKAVEWWTKAADVGFACSQQWLAKCYFAGEGVEVNEAKAIDLWSVSVQNSLENAADRISAQYALHWAFYLGWGVEKDAEKCKEWWCKYNSMRNDFDKGFLLV